MGTGHSKDGHERGLLSTVAGELGRVLCAQGRLEEAERFTEVSQKLAGSADAAPQISWRTLCAKILAQRHQLDSADTLAREALDLAERADDLKNQGRVFMDLAEILEIARSNR